MLHARICATIKTVRESSKTPHHADCQVTRFGVTLVEQLHSRGVFWRILPGDGAGPAGAAAGGPAAVGLGDSWKRGT